MSSVIFSPKGEGFPPRLFFAQINMETDTTPPPQVYAQAGLPDYYLGCLLYYDDDGDDCCRWVVYDGANKVRCPTRKDAIDYITTRRDCTADDIIKLMTSARMGLARAMADLDRAARYCSGPQRLLLERLAVKLRPFVVDLDNTII